MSTINFAEIINAINSDPTLRMKTINSIEQDLKKAGFSPKDIQQVNNENSFNNPSFRALKQKLVENIPTLIKNSNSIIPLNLKQNKILNIRFGNANGDEFIKYLNKYSKVDSFVINDSTSVEEIKILSNIG